MTADAAGSGRGDCAWSWREILRGLTNFKRGAIPRASVLYTQTFVCRWSAVIVRQTPHQLHNRTMPGQLAGRRNSQWSSLKDPVCGDGMKMRTERKWNGSRAVTSVPWTQNLSSVARQRWVARKGCNAGFPRLSIPIPLPAHGDHLAARPLCLQLSSVAAQDYQRIVCVRNSLI